jgi:hypothetical protein
MPQDPIELTLREVHENLPPEAGLDEFFALSAALIRARFVDSHRAEAQ